jgi:AraC-like DNA-binding protein
MIHAPLLIIPGLVCLFTAAAHAMLASRTPTFRILFLLCISIFFTIAGDILLAPLTDSDAIAHIVIALFAPSIIPMVRLYFLYLHHPFTYRPALLLWVAVPFILATASITLTSVMGLEQTDALLERIHAGTFDPHDTANSLPERYYYYWTVIPFRCVILAEFLYMAVYSFILAKKLHFRPRNIHNFLFRGQRIRLLEVQMTLAYIIVLILCLKVLLHSNIFLNSRAWAYSIACLQSVFYFLLGFFALFGTEKYITLHDTQTLMRFNYRPETRSDFAEQVITDMSGYLEGDALTRVLSRLGTQRGAAPVRDTGGKLGTAPSLSSAVLNVISRPYDENSLEARFRHLMQDEQVFLQPGLTLNDVAARLNTNKTYVSKMVNRTTNLGFPEVLNIMRVDYAQRYIRSHPEASQEEIAKACGFQSASTFNGTFKRITGFTPKVWAARKDSSGR